MLLDRHHDQHMRQEEDGEDGASLPPARYAGTKRSRRSRGDKFGEEEEEDFYGDEEGEEDYDVEDDIDDDLAPVEDGTSKCLGLNRLMPFLSFACTLAKSTVM